MRSRIISHSNSAKAPANSNLSRVEAGKVQFFGISKGRDTKILITPESDMSHGFLARNFGPVRLPVKKPKPPSALQFSIACMRPVARIPCAPSRRPHGLADKAQASFFTFSSATTPLSHQLLVLLFAQRARKPAGGEGGSHGYPLGVTRSVVTIHIRRSLRPRRSPSYAARATPSSTLLQYPIAHDLRCY